MFAIWQISGATVGDVRIVSDMHERKAEMAREADAFIALPGNICVPIFLMKIIKSYSCTWSNLNNIIDFTKL